MKLHDLRPAPGSNKDRTRVGRGIAAGKGKTAGRGTKGQKARAGGSIPPWFEGGQTPLHMRIPKLRGFKNRFKTEYRIVNIGTIAEYAAEGRFADVELPGGSAAPLTINAELLRVAGLIGSHDVPVKVLGNGDVDRPLFVIAEAFTRTAREKIEAAGGTAQVLVSTVPGVPDAPIALTSRDIGRASAAAAAIAAADPAPSAVADTTTAEPAAKQRSRPAKASSPRAEAAGVETQEPETTTDETAAPAETAGSDAPAPDADSTATDGAAADPQAASDEPATESSASTEPGA